MPRNFNELSDAEKRRMAGQCNFCCLYMITCIAFAFTLVGFGFCSFVRRSMTVNGSVEELCANYPETEEQCNSVFSNVGIGFYAWEATVPVDQKICLDYTQPIAGVGYVTPTFDTKFNSSKAFAIVATVFGAMAFFTMMFASCCPLTPERMGCLSIYFWMACFFQGMTLLILRSSACKKGFFAPYFQNYDVSGDFIESVSCSLDKGSRYAIAACALYFYCMLLVPKAIPPPPIGMDTIGMGGGEAAAEADEEVPTAAAEEEVPASGDKAEG